VAELETGVFGETDTLFDVAYRCILLSGAGDKVAATRRAAALWRDGALDFHDRGSAVLPIDQPGRPPELVLVPPKHLHRRNVHSREGLQALIHAIAHIEFNAINLAWDAVYRFRGMPEAFYRDWVRVAEEEARHFEWLQRRLGELDCRYGELPAHDGLWDMARRTGHDVLVRMALVPRVLEARGLDASPKLLEKLSAAGDLRSVRILERIFADEIGHVEIGTRWFRYCCRQRGLAPEATFQALLERYFHGEIRGPFHHAARRQAGFNDRELALLEALGRGGKRP